MKIRFKNMNALNHIRRENQDFGYGELNIGHKAIQIDTVEDARQLYEIVNSGDFRSQWSSICRGVTLKLLKFTEANGVSIKDINLHNRAGAGQGMEGPQRDKQEDDYVLPRMADDDNADAYAEGVAEEGEELEAERKQQAAERMQRANEKRNHNGEQEMETQHDDDAIKTIASALKHLADGAINEERAIELIREHGGIDEDAVREIVGNHMADIAPRSMTIKVNDKPPVEMDEQTHPMFEKVLRLTAAGLNVLLVGPAGTGKSHMAHQVARALNRDFGSISMTAGASESQLVGRFLPTGENARFEYTDTSFVRCYTGGGVFLFDELDAADPNMLLIVNSALANGGFHNDMRTDDPYMERHPDAVIMGAANTYGTGADMMYTGRAQLDEATRDRWYIVHIDYNESLEREFAGMAPKPRKQWKADESEITESERTDIYQWVMSIRKAIDTYGLQRVASTRMIQKAVAARTAGVPLNEIKSDLLAGWTRDELAKVN